MSSSTDPSGNITGPHRSPETVPCALLDNLLEGFQVVSPEFRYLYLNEIAARHGQSTREALLGRTMMEAYPGIENTEMFSILRRSMTDRVPLRLENEFTFSDGSRGWFDLRFEPVDEGVAILSIDITASHHAGTALRRANRALTLVLRCNHALVGADDEATLLQTVCEVAVREAGYRLAWIGLKVDDPHHTVHPVAAAGADEGYLASVDVTWDDSPTGRGPTGRAIRAGQVVIAHHLATEADYEPWRAAALERGFVSSIALPLLVDGRVAGALNVYASEPDAFDEAERDVLQELALDLGYGIGTLRARVAQREMDARFRNLYENSLDGVILCDADGNVFSANPAACRMLGYTEEGLRRLGRMGVVDPQDLRLQALVARRAETREARGQLTLRRANGTRFEAEISSSLFDSAEGLRAAVIIHDISARAEAEARQRQSEERYRRLTENLPDMVWRTTVEGRVVFVNSAVTNLLGYAPPDLTGHPITAFMARPSRERLEAWFDTARQNPTLRTVFLAEVDQLDHQGRPVPTELHAVPIHEDDLLVGFEGISRDIRERKRVEREQAEMRAQLQQAQRLESVGRLAGGIAHDFNNLLSVIVGCADLTAAALHELDPLHSNIVEIQRASQRAAALTRQLLAFGRKQVLEPEVLDLNAVVVGVESMLCRLLGEDVEIQLDLTTPLEKVLADCGQIEQVLMNLAVNARDAMPDGGSLRIQTSHVDLDEHDDHRLEGSPGRHVLLAVADTGTGISPEIQERIFEPFFTTKERGKGTGLGLATAYGIIKQSNGSIHVDSVPGHGTTFKIYLPVVVAAANTPTHRTPPVFKGGERTILIVEDENAVRRVTERILERAGYRVLSAGSGLDALTLWERHGHAIDLVLTDVVMPGMNGHELAQRLITLRPSLRILFMSGYTDDAIGPGGVLESGTAFIGKPFAAADLVRKIREVLEDAGV